MFDSNSKILRIFVGAILCVLNVSIIQFSWLESLTSMHFNNYEFNPSNATLDQSLEREVDVTNVERRANNIDDDEEEDNRPTNLHLALLGDSVTRYQYISLMYYLMTGKWYYDEGELNQSCGTNYTSQSLLYRGSSQKTWNSYLQFSNDHFHPYEQCDCYRLGSGGYSKIGENRYYRDPVRNNTLSFVLKFGKASSNGRFEAPVRDQQYPRLNVSNPPGDYKWTDYNWSQVIRQHIALLEPKPTHLVFNAGLHNHDLDQVAVQKDIQQALDDTGIVGIYKTTTRTSELTRTRRFARGAKDKSLCGAKVVAKGKRTGFPNCINLDWTGDLIGDKFYYDDPHLRGLGNQIMNMQLLDYLQNNKNGRGVARIENLKTWMLDHNVSSPCT